MTRFPVWKTGLAGLSLFARPGTALAAIAWTLAGGAPYLAFLTFAILPTFAMSDGAPNGLLIVGVFAALFVGLWARAQASWHVYHMVLGPRPGDKGLKLAPVFDLYFVRRRASWWYIAPAFAAVLGFLGGSVAAGKVDDPWRGLVVIAGVLPGLVAYLFVFVRLSLVNVIAYAEPKTLPARTCIGESWRRTKPFVVPLMAMWLLVFLLDMLAGGVLVLGGALVLTRGEPQTIFDLLGSILPPWTPMDGAPAPDLSLLFSVWVVGFISALTSPIFTAAAKATAYRELTAPPAPSVEL